jgi:hypothetical protein
MPCRVGGTLWKTEVWQGKVILGITDDACIVKELRFLNQSKLGQFAWVNASGRTPSRLTKTTHDKLFLLEDNAALKQVFFNYLSSKDLMPGFFSASSLYTNSHSCLKMDFTETPFILDKITEIGSMFTG